MKIQKIKITTYNILHCEDWKKKKIDYAAFAEAIKGFDSDVISLNEVRGEGEREGYDAQARILSELTGYTAYFAKALDVDGKNPYGNAILTRLPMKSFETVPIPDPRPGYTRRGYETRCILKAVTATDPEITFLITHFGLHGDEQQNAVCTVMKNITSPCTVLSGDFNVTPENPVLAPIREKLNDTAALITGSALTFPSDKPDRKIDYIFAGSGFEITSCEVSDRVLSDHRAVSAELEVTDNR